MTRKIGFIGYRNHAKKLLDIVENKENFEISKIYHPTKNIDDSRITNNLKDLHECDGVFIASPNNTHFEYLKEMIENFKGGFNKTEILKMMIEDGFGELKWEDLKAGLNRVERSLSEK